MNTNSNVSGLHTISVNYIGRLGNNMFQFAFANILIKAINDHMNTCVLNTKNIAKTDQLKVIVNEQFDIAMQSDIAQIQKLHQNAEIRITDYGPYEGRIVNVDQVINHTLTTATGFNINFHLDGFFQHKTYYEGKRTMLQNMFIKPKYNSKDTAIHIRLSDYKNINWTLSESYYDNCINLANPESLDVYTDEPDHKYIEALESRGANIINGDPLKDLISMAAHKKIILSRSSYSWWSAILSNANEIYYPKPASGFWSEQTPHKDISIKDGNFIFVNC